MLYDEAIKQLDSAVDLLNGNSKQLDEISNRILKAQDIITELMVSLDFDNGGEIASKLFGLYRYFNDQLMEANINKTSEPLTMVRGLMVELRDAWIQILGKTNVEGAATGGVNIADASMAGKTIPISVDSRIVIDPVCPPRIQGQPGEIQRSVKLLRVVGVEQGFEIRSPGMNGFTAHPGE